MEPQRLSEILHGDHHHRTGPGQDGAAAVEIAETIRLAVADDALAEIVVRRVAIATADGLVSRSDLNRVLQYIADGRRSGAIARPGAYFCRCAQDLYRRAGLPWQA
jgi:hypothetical protein